MDTKNLNVINLFNSLPCQTDVHIQIPTPHKPIRLRSKLLGIEPGMCVILSRGIDQQWQGAKEYIREGQTLVVRLINDQDPDATIFAFRASISKLMSAVGRWVVVDFPKQVQLVNLRQHTRFPIALRGFLSGPDDAKGLHEGELRDVSISGGGFISPPLSFYKQDQEAELTVELGNDEQIKASVELCNQQLVSHSPQLVHYGLKYTGQSQHVRKFVQQVMLESLLKENKTSQ